MTDQIRLIRKKEEYRAFIEIIKNRNVSHWMDIARALRINKDTITEWKKFPEVQEAMIIGIVNAFGKMEETGKNDWRMWETKLKMLG